VQKKPIRLTRHAVQRALKYDLTPELIERIILEGKRQTEGKSKAKYMLRTKNGVWIAICQESPDQMIIVILTKGR
jgi:hypothetical protein